MSSHRKASSKANNNNNDKSLSSSGNWMESELRTSGCRGGRANFSWDSIADQKTRTFYLANSLCPSSKSKAAMGKDPFWWTAKKQLHSTGEVDSSKCEDDLESIKKQEEEMMQAALRGEISKRKNNGKCAGVHKSTTIGERPLNRRKDH